MTSVTSSTRTEWTTRLAQALVQAGYDTDSNIKPLVNEAIATDQSLAYLLVSRKMALPSVVVGTLSQLSQIPAIDLAAFTPQPDATAAMPLSVAREFHGLALQFDGSNLAVAFAEPPGAHEVDDAFIPDRPTSPPGAGRSGADRSVPRCSRPAGPAGTAGPAGPGTAEPDRRRPDPRTRRRRSRTCWKVESRPCPKRGPASYRRPAAIRSVGRRLRSPPHGGHARDHPPQRSHAPGRRMPSADQRHHPGHDFRHPCRHHSGSDSKPSTSWTLRTPSPVSVGSA